MRLTSRPPLEHFGFIDQALPSRKWPTALKLALVLEVTVRTIRRDLHPLRDHLHAPVAYYAARRGRR